MLTRKDDVDPHAVRSQGWTITAIAKHLGHDRKTIWAYLAGDCVAGEDASSHPDPLEPFLAYATQRLLDHPHVWGTTLFDEFGALGYPLSYPSFTRGLRGHGLRPPCEPYSASTGRDQAIIDHPAGEETQGRGTLAADETLPQLVQGHHQVSQPQGGLAKTWRVDRMATVASPNPRRVTATFAAIAKQYAVHVALCPPRHSNR